MTDEYDEDFDYTDCMCDLCYYYGPEEDDEDSDSIVDPFGGESSPNVIPSDEEQPERGACAT